MFLTGLHWAVKRGHFKVCELLLKHNAHVNALDILGRTPLYFALTSQKLDLYCLLLFYKADVRR